MKKEEISLKNTKSEILQALNEALAREKNLSSTKSDPVKEENEKIMAKAIETSKVNVEQSIFSEELVKKFKNLEMAISVEEEKLKNLYDVEKELQNITLAVNAGKDCIAQVENEKKAKIEELENKLVVLEDTYKAKNLELQKQFDDKSKLLKIEREREVEEYNYKLKRDREIESNKWEDEKTIREANLAKTELEADKLLKDATEKSEYIKGLEAKVNEIPKLLQSEYERGKKEITKELEKEFAHKTALSEKDYANTADRLNDKVETLKEELAKSLGLNTVLQEKLDNAYIEIKELATKTVESAGKIKIINNSSNDD